MARITVAEREQKKQMMDDLIFRLFMTEGWEVVTYDRLAKELGMGKSSIQRYYESKNMFMTALQGKVFPLAMQKLDFSTSEAFINSWVKAYHDEDSHVFREVVRMLMDNIMSSGTAPQAKAAIYRMIQQLENIMPHQEAEDTMKMVLGCTVYAFLED
ncbi:TetR family transcriptional regulator [Vibrio lamellibrachiae]|uniref:TetR family transcriptional regulator n=1 Tax=Vibrio lamellibrachiae TaxID=2910253 RepID=UPI003D150C05